MEGSVIYEAKGLVCIHGCPGHDVYPEDRFRPTLCRDCYEYYCLREHLARTPGQSRRTANTYIYQPTPVLSDRPKPPKLTRQERARIAKERERQGLLTPLEQRIFDERKAYYKRRYQASLERAARAKKTAGWDRLYAVLCSLDTDSKD